MRRRKKNGKLAAGRTAIGVAVLLAAFFFTPKSTAHDPGLAGKSAAGRENLPPRFQSEEENVPSLRGGAANIAVVEDDGTMVANGLFVMDRLMAAFNTFYPDSFDLVNVFGASSYPDSLRPAVSEYLVRNHVAGLGMSSDLNRNAVIGMHTARMKSIQLMGDLRHFGPTPSAPIPRFSVGFTGLELLASEVLHANGCYVKILNLGGDILGRLNAHWSFFLSSQASVMEGCSWQDNGGGTFTTMEVLNEISELDEYLFGLRPASQVSPMFVLDDPDSFPPAGDATFPFPGFTTGAQRIDFTIDDIIQENGPRVPNASTAPHEFTMAFVLVVPQGTSAPPEDLAYLEQFREEWEAYFSQETEQAGTMSTTIPQVPAVADFTVDRFAGNTPLSVGFTARPSGTIAWLSWDFGDGSPSSSEIRPVHVYASPGTFVAKLTVMGVSGPSMKTKTVRVAPVTALVENDFESGPQGWTLFPPNTAPAGRWEWGDPEGTSTFGVFVQPEDDHTPAGVQCWTTDKEAGGFPSDLDVDGGITTLRSPFFNLSAANDPYVSYARWYSNSLAGHSDEDTMSVDVSSNGGANWVRLETISVTDTKWNTAQFRLSDFISLTETVCFRVQASDLGGQSLVEAAFDDFAILDLPLAVASEEPPFPWATGAFRLPPNRPNPFAGTTVLQYELPSTRLVTVSVYDLGGRLVRILERGTRETGLREILWDGRDESGSSVGSGVYVVRIDSREGSASRKIQIVH